MIQSNKLIIGIDGGDFYPFEIVNSGIKRIVDSFLKNIRLIEGYEIVINYYYFGEVKNIEIPKKLPYILNIRRLPTKFFSSFFLPYNVLKDKNNIYIGFSSVTPHFLGYFPIKKISFLYDLGFLTYPALYKSPERMIDHTIQTIILSDALIVLSNAAKKSIQIGIKDVNTNKIIVKYPGNDHIKVKGTSKAPLKQPYFLYVGVIKPIKDVKRLIQIFNGYKKRNPDSLIKLVIIGRYEIGYWKSILRSLEDNIYKKDIIFMQDLKDDQLLNYYEHAMALINVSKVEGLGFPVLEALSLKKTVIVNDLSIYNEFKHKYKNLWIGRDDKAIIKLMENSTKNTLQDLTTTELFTWKEFTDKILETAMKLNS